MRCAARRGLRPAGRNKTGTRGKFLFVLSILLTVVKSTFSYLLVLVASLGWGVTRPYLDAQVILKIQAGPCVQTSRVVHMLGEEGCGERSPKPKPARCCREHIYGRSLGEHREPDPPWSTQQRTRMHRFPSEAEPCEPGSPLASLDLVYKEAPFELPPSRTCV